MSNCHRITFKRARPNPIFQEWLEELYEEAAAKKSKLEFMLKEALESIAKYPLPLQSGAECAILKGFDKRLCAFLDKRLQVYNYNKSLEQNEELPSSKNCYSDDTETYDLEDDRKMINAENIDHASSSNNSVGIKSPLSQREIIHIPQPENSSNKIKRNAKKTDRNNYKPTFRSGGYAILITLLEQLKDNPNNPSLKKDELIERAQKHSEESFTRPKPESFYTAWSTMSKLISKGLVSKARHKKVEFSLTEQGIAVANELLLESAHIPTNNDIIFNNAVPINNPVIQCLNKNSLDKQEQLENRHDAVIKMPAGSFNVILLIDKHETSGMSKKNDPTVAQFNKYPDLKHEYRSLKVGDFMWIARHKHNVDEELVLPYIVERKRMDDLGASIKDGRFHEQKFRLRKSGLKNVIYLVENYGSNKHVGLPIQSLMQALQNTRVQDNFNVHMTDSLTNSARFLAMMTKRLTIEYKDKALEGYDKETEGNGLLTFSFLNKVSSKTKPLTVTETFIKLLLQLKGASVEKALAITDVYKTPHSLILAYSNCNRKEGEFLLANLKYGDMTRNVGPTVSKSIYHLLSNIDIS